MKPCAHCGGENRDQARFCGHCGKRFPVPPPEPPAPPAPTPAAGGPLASNRVYAVLVALGWLTLFMPFVTVRACSSEHHVWGMDWVAQRYGGNPHGERLAGSSGEHKVTAEPTRDLITDTMVAGYRRAPFLVRLFLWVQPIPELSYPLLLLVLGLAGLEWYDYISRLALLGIGLCAHTLFNLACWSHLLAREVVEFGFIEIGGGWGLWALGAVWAVIFGLSRLQQ